MVTADGDVVTASPDENPELFWGLRGGGGNFGIVTGFTFRLHEVGTRALVADYTFPLEDAQPAFEGGGTWRRTPRARRPSTRRCGDGVARSASSGSATWRPAGGCCPASRARPARVASVAEMSYLDLQTPRGHDRAGVRVCAATGRATTCARCRTARSRRSSCAAAPTPRCGPRPRCRRTAARSPTCPTTRRRSGSGRRVRVRRGGALDRPGRGRRPDGGRPGGRGRGGALRRRGLHQRAGGRGRGRRAPGVPGSQAGPAAALKRIYDPGNVFHLNQNITPETRT